MKNLLRALISQGIEALRANGTLPADSLPPDFVVERPKTRDHGDFATNAAMLLAKAARSNPRALAQALVEALPRSEDVSKVEIAGPGFINFHLAPAAYQREAASVIKEAHDYGRNLSGNGRTVGVEYVSANPTGPLHVGHGRAAAIGDCVARVLDANGWNAKREFYYNDAGVQIENLALSTQARIKGIAPDQDGWPEGGYRGEYIADVARAYMAGASVDLEGSTVVGAKDPDDMQAIRRFAVAYLRNEQNLDLAAFGVDFDIYFLESSLYADGKVAEAVAKLQASGHTYEEGGALWLRSTDFGDDKDRVMRKSDGTFTYFVPDVAYHLSKWQRGYERAITELGADHHGSLARVRAGLQAMEVGIPQGWPEYVLHQMVTVMRGGEEVKLSKRAGSYFTLRDLIEEAGVSRPSACARRRADGDARLLGQQQGRWHRRLALGPAARAGGTAGGGGRGRHPPDLLPWPWRFDQPWRWQDHARGRCVAARQHRWPPAGDRAGRGDPSQIRHPRAGPALAGTGRRCSAARQPAPACRRAPRG